MRAEQKLYNRIKCFAIINNTFIKQCTLLLTFPSTVISSSLNPELISSLMMVLRRHYKDTFSTHNLTKSPSIEYAKEDTWDNKAFQRLA